LGRPHGQRRRAAIYFYTRHPISSAIILSKLRAARGHLDGVTPYELFPHDRTTMAPLRRTMCWPRPRTSARVARCGFLRRAGRPARYLAFRYGADVTGIELTPARVAGAAR